MFRSHFVPPLPYATIDYENSGHRYAPYGETHFGDNDDRLTFVRDWLTGRAVPGQGICPDFDYSAKVNITVGSRGYLPKSLP